MCKWISKKLKYNEKYNVSFEEERGPEKLKERLILSHLLKNGETNCAGFSNLTYILGKICNLNISVIKGKKHSWNSIRIYGKNYEFDPTSFYYFNKMGKLDLLNFKNFYLTKEQMKSKLYNK